MLMSNAMSAAAGKLKSLAEGRWQDRADAMIARNVIASEITGIKSHANAERQQPKR